MRSTARGRLAHKCDDKSCVCNVVREIAAKQDSIVQNNNCCDVSCAESIRELVSPLAPIQVNTVPFVLYCKGSCKPFFANGIFKETDPLTSETYFDCITSPVFRVKRVDKDCCAVLELLLPVEYEAATETNGRNKGKKKKKCHVKDVCDLFPADEFDCTGICITVDLKKFSAIQCLPPILC